VPDLRNRIMGLPVQEEHSFTSHLCLVFLAPLYLIVETEKSIFFGVFFLSRRLFVRHLFSANRRCISSADTSVPNFRNTQKFMFVSLQGE
jgi:hypothetical protein